MKPNRHSLLPVAWPLAVGLAVLPYVSVQAQASPSSMTQALTPALIAAMCGGAGGAAGAAGGAGAGAAMSGLMAMLCKNSGVPLQALSGMVSQLMSGGGGGGGGSSGSSTPNVSGLPVIAYPTPTPTVTQPTTATVATTPTRIQTPDYGPLVPEVAKRNPSTYSYNQVGVTGDYGGAGGGIRLPNGQPARETGVRIGGLVNGSQMASLGGGNLNVGTSQAVMVGEQKVDWFTLGYDDGQNGRPKQTFADATEQFQYDSGYALGVQYPIQKPVV